MLQASYKTQPYAHQVTAVEQSWNVPGYAYLMEMGTGKTKVTIDVAAALWNGRYINGVLIIAPKGMYHNWLEKEFPAHCAVEYVGGQWKSGMTEAQERQLRDNLRYGGEGKLRVLVVNVEALLSERCVTLCKAFLKNFSCLMAVDESTCIKNFKAKRTKAVWDLGKLAKFRRILTGSPITQSPLDLFAQFYFLDPAILGDKNYYAFKRQYALTQTIRLGQRSFEKVVGFHNLDRLKTRMAQNSYRVTKEECLDLPQKIYTTRDVELTDEQLKIYKELKTNAMVQLEGEVLSAPLAITQLLRAHQLICGHLPKSDQDSTPVPIKSNRLSVLMEAIDEVSGKAIIWATYRADILAIEKAVAEEYGENAVASYYGDTSSDERAARTKRFQEDPTLRFLVMQPKSAGRGLTLTAANTVIYYSNDFNLEMRMQSEDRAHRIGQHWPVTYIDLVAKGTIDEKIIKALKEKKNLADVVVDEGPRFWM